MKKSKHITVTCCKDCPLVTSYGFGSDNYVCDHPEGSGEIIDPYEAKEIHPDCPLLSQTLIIKAPTKARKAKADEQAQRDLDQRIADELEQDYMQQVFNAANSLDPNSPSS